MTIIELKDQIIKNQLSNFYIFVGEEIGIMNIYLEQMSNKISLKVIRENSFLDAYNKCQGGSLFGDTTGFYVIRNDTDIQKQDKLFDTLKDNIGNNTIVLLYDKIDSRLKFGKHFKDDIVMFEKLAPSILKSYIKKAINLNDKNIETLIDICSGSYDMCMLEVDKIKQYKQAVDESDYNICFTDLLEDGVIYQPEESDVFKFTEAVCNKNVNKAFEIEEVLRNNNISSINILGTLYNTMKSVMLIQCCEGDNITEVTGLDNKQIYFAKRYVNKYNIGTLVEAVKLIPTIIEQVKSGLIDDEYATRYVLTKIC